VEAGWEPTLLVFILHPEGLRRYAKRRGKGREKKGKRKGKEREKKGVPSLRVRA
jgi:hypothetical protein